MIALVLLVYGDRSEYECLKMTLDVTMQLSLSCWKTLHCSSMNAAGKYQLKKKKELYIPSHQSTVDWEISWEIIGKYLEGIGFGCKKQ